jgi:hypothetical protein
VLAKCANPACGAHFLYLHEGRIFNFPFSDDGTPGKGLGRVEHFWLCGRCAASLTVVMNEGSVQVRFRRLELTDGQARSQYRKPPSGAA